MTMWYYAQAGERQGPIEEQALRELLNQGKLGAETLVWTQGMAQWTAARETVLASSIAAPPPLVVPPMPSAAPAAAPAPALGPTQSAPVYTSSIPQYASTAVPAQALPPADKERVVYVLLAVLLPLGIHNFYAGYTSRAIWQLILAIPIGIVTCGISAFAVWIWSIVEAITVTHDAQGRPLR